MNPMRENNKEQLPEGVREGNCGHGLSRSPLGGKSPERQREGKRKR